MKKIICFIIVLGNFSVSAQTNKEKKKTGGSDHIVSFGVNLPLADFSSTHSIGFGIGYSPGTHVFGLVKNKHFAFTYNGGVAYYIGKKETVSSYPYKYPGYFFIHAFAGVLYNPASKIDFKLTAGPALGIYNGNSKFNIGAALEGAYYLNNQFIVAPGFFLMKENKSDPLWAGSLKLGYLF